VSDRGRELPRPPRVLLVDDNAEDRGRLATLLQEEGIDIVGEAGDGVEGVAIARSLEPDVILMDLRMPLMDGFQATREILKVQPLVQVLILTVYDDPSLDRSAAEAGAYAYLVKGCSVELIRDILLQAAKVKGGLEADDPRALTPPKPEIFR
jgi:NarL family two-component system response regulator LiaR